MLFGKELYWDICLQVKFKKILLQEWINQLPDDKILDWSKLKQIADNILKCIPNEKQEPQIVARYARLTPSCNHPRNFITIPSIVLEICSGQNYNMKINKGQ